MNSVTDSEIAWSLIDWPSSCVFIPNAKTPNTKTAL